MGKYHLGTDRNEQQFLPPAIEDYVPADSPVRAIDAFVDELDLAELGFATRTDSSIGRSSYDPAALLKLYMWGYIKRTRSSRTLEDACRSNLNAIWLTGNIHPDHSTISDFRKRNATALPEVLGEFNHICIQAGLFGRELVAIDGTFVKAVNSRARSFTRRKINKMLAGIEEAVGRYLGELDRHDSEEAELAGAGGGVAGLEEKLEEVRKLQGKIKRAGERRAKLEGHLAQCGRTGTGQANLTDGESVQLRKGGKNTVGYNVQSAVDSKHHLVAAIDVTQDGNDRNQLAPMSQAAKEAMGMGPDAPLDALADTGYSCGEQLAACAENNTRALVPIAEPGKKSGDGTYTSKDFTHQPESDSYLCPQGKTLTRKKDREKESGTYRAYHDVGECRGCPMLGKCTKSSYRILQVNIHKEEMEATKKRLAAEPGAMRARGAIVEHPFGTIKANGSGDLLCRGLELARAEMGLSFWAYNFTRVTNILGVPGLIEFIRSGKRRAAEASA